LIHVGGKLFSKVLACRLAPKISSLIHSSQSAFIQGRSIHDSFRFVQASAKLLHARKCSSLLLKVDIARAFDSVDWPFLLKIMRHVGFQNCWLNWTSAILSTASTRILLNGMPGTRICHSRGLRQGDPLSPLLFILVMEVLTELFRKADEWSLLQKSGPRAIPYRASLYADDMVAFLSPTVQDLQMARCIFNLFDGASGLGCNLSKCQLAPIRCTEEQVRLAIEVFPCSVVDFPVRYLGIPLAVSRLPKSVWQPMIDKVADKLPTWHGRLMHMSGRLALIKSTLSAMPIHTAISLTIPRWVQKALVKLMKAFLWCGSESLQNGKCRWHDIACRNPSTWAALVF
jgi:hypothetical protein